MKTTPLPEGAVLDAVPDAILVADEEGRYIHANRAALDLLGYTLEELLELRVPDLVSASVAWSETEFRRFREQGYWRGHLELRRRDGSTVFVESVARPVESEAGWSYFASMRPALAGPQEGTGSWHEEISRAIASSPGIEAAAPSLVEILANRLGWDVAELWIPDQAGQNLRRMGVWHTPSADLEAFVAAGDRLAIGRGVGLVGRAWEERRPVWLGEGLEGTGSPRIDAASAAGLSAAFAVPLHSADHVVGVIAFFSRAARTEDPALLQTLEPIAGQLAEFVHRVLTERMLRESHDQLASILGGVGDGITVQDPAGALVFANDGAARALGFDSAEELLATPLADVMGRFEILTEDGEPMPVDRLPGRRALTGEEGAKEIVRFRVTATGEQRWSLVTASPVFDDEGRVRFAINIFQDITERRRIEERSRFLGEASAALASSLDYDTTLASVARLAVQGLADWCVIHVDEEGTLRRLEVAHADESKTPLVEELQERYGQEPSASLLEVMRTGRPVLIPEITDDMLQAAAKDYRHLNGLRALGFRSAILAPIRTQDEVLGVITFVSSSSGRRFDGEDLALAEELGRRAGIAVAHARLYRARSRVARSLQESLLPPELPSVPGFEMAARYRPAEEDVAGDFYDAFPLGDGTWGVMIGDVCGKGAEAAALTALSRHTVRSAAIERRSPGEALETLNRALLRQDLDGRFCTMVAGILEREGDRARVRLSNAGHPMPRILRANGTVEAAGASGTVLGVIEDFGADERTIVLERGDSLVLITDGVTDDFRLQGNAVGEALAEMHGGTAEDIAERLERLPEATGVPPRDDLAVLVFRFLG